MPRIKYSLKTEVAPHEWQDEFGTSSKRKARDKQIYLLNTYGIETTIFKEVK